jgi:hypothetical protein
VLLGAEQKDPDEPADHALGRSRGGFSTKIHVLCDGHGHPLQWFPFWKVPMDGDGELIVWPVALARDKGYRAFWLDEFLLELEIAPAIPPKEKRRPYDSASRVRS